MSVGLQQSQVFGYSSCKFHCLSMNILCSSGKKKKTKRGELGVIGCAIIPRHTQTNDQVPIREQTCPVNGKRGTYFTFRWMSFPYLSMIFPLRCPCLGSMEAHCLTDVRIQPLYMGPNTPCVLTLLILFVFLSTAIQNFGII